jgi:hypothetical protein
MSRWNYSIPLAILLLLITYNTAQTINAQIEVNPGAANNLDTGNQKNQTQGGSNNSTTMGQTNLVIPPSSRSTYRDSIGDLHIVGQVENNFTFPIQFVQITGTVYDSSRQLVSTGNTYTNVDELGPGEKSGFDVLLTNVPSGASNYAVSASYQQASTSKPAALSINVGRPNIDIIKAYHLLGEVTNQGNNTATFVKVSAVFFDANHKVMDAVDTYTSPSDLQPGQKAPFNLQSLSPNTRQIKFA